MSVWSTSTGRNTVFAAQSGGEVLPTSHLPIHVHVAHAHLRNPDGHCFHKPYHDHHCQVGTHLFIPRLILIANPFLLILTARHARTRDISVSCLSLFLFCVLCRTYSYTIPCHFLCVITVPVPSMYILVVVVGLRQLTVIFLLPRIFRRPDLNI